MQPFREQNLPRADDKEHFNDDVSIEHSQNSTKHYDGAVFIWVVEARRDFTSISERTIGAPPSPFYRSLHTPRPTGSREAALFIRGPPDNSILSFWNAQLHRLDNLIAQRPIPNLDGATSSQTPPACGR